MVFLYVFLSKIVAKAKRTCFFYFVDFKMFVGLFSRLTLFGIESNRGAKYVTDRRILHRLENKQAYTFPCHFSEGTTTFMQNKFSQFLKFWLHQIQSAYIFGSISEKIARKKIIHQKIHLAYFNPCIWYICIFGVITTI